MLQMIYLSILHQSSKFINLKYYYLNKLLFKEKIIDKELDYLLKQKIILQV